MNRSKLHGRAGWLVAATITVLAFGGGLAFAAIPSGDSAVISGCYEKRTGLLRVIDAEAGKLCTQWETPISWNERGAVGPPGAPGAEGPAGPSGPVSGWEVKLASSAIDSAPFTNTKGAIAECSPGKKVIGGGGRIYASPSHGVMPGVAIVSSGPSTERSWVAQAAEMVPTDGDWYVTAQIICAYANP